MNATTITSRAPLSSRLLAWMRERFPPANIVAAVLVWAATLVWGRALSVSGPLPLRPRDVIGAMACIGFFLMLRVFDEHKDYASDCVAHPGRVLQRGVITLRHLKVVGGLAIGVQLGASMAVDGGLGPLTGTWLATFAWSLLMAKEFFVADWLRPRLVLYAISHMFVMPLAVFWLVQMAAGGAPLPMAAWILPAVSYLTGFAFEIARKLKAPADERNGVDSYTRALGTRTAPIVLLGVLTVASAGFYAMLTWVVDGWPAPAGGVLLAAILLPAWIALLRFRYRTDRASAKASEAAVGLAIVGSHLVLVIMVVIARGAAHA